MTNTLHRFGKPGDLKDDYIVFIMSSKGINDVGALEKVRAFLRAALKYQPVNVGHSPVGPLYRAEKDLNPFKLYFRGRRERVSPEQITEELQAPGSGMVVFDNREALEGFLREVREMDLGLSVNVSALVDDVREVAARANVIPHSVNYALGFRGDLHLLPDHQVLALTTMCGHGLISANFAKEMIGRVKERRLTPEQAAGYMAKFCVCGAFNTARAVRLLKEARTSN